METPAYLAPGKTAVITGAALGIGRTLAIDLAGRGMNVCLVDLPGERLDSAAARAAEAAPNGVASILAQPCDVSKPNEIAALKDAVAERFVRADLLVANAVTRTGRGFGADRAEWRAAMEVNFWGVVELVDAFLPLLSTGPDPAAIVAVGSKQGITNPPGHPIYNVAKSALKTYTEALEHDLRTRHANEGGARVSAHLLVPGWTTTGTAEHKPGAWLPEQVVERLIEGLSAERFYVICPDDEVTEEMDRKRILWGAGDITEDRPPLSRWHPDHAEAAKKACT